MSGGREMREESVAEDRRRDKGVDNVFMKVCKCFMNVQKSKHTVLQPASFLKLVKRRSL